jgi:hypothetical protein
MDKGRGGGGFVLGIRGLGRGRVWRGVRIFGGARQGGGFKGVREGLKYMGEIWLGGASAEGLHSNKTL